MTTPNTTRSSGPPVSSQISTHFGGPVLLFGAYLFFYSWLLLFYYFKTFGISLVSLEIPVNFYLAFAWAAVENFGVGLVAYLVLGAVTYVCLDTCWGWDKFWLVSFFHRALFAVFLVGGVVVTAIFAQAHGELQAQQVRDGGVLPHLRIFFEKDKAALFPAILSVAQFTPDDGVKEASLLIETPAAFYVLVQKVISEERQYDSMGTVYRVPKEYVIYSEIDVSNTPRVERVLSKFLRFFRLSLSEGS